MLHKLRSVRSALCSRAASGCRSWAAQGPAKRLWCDAAQAAHHPAEVGGNPGSFAAAKAAACIDVCVDAWQLSRAERKERVTLCTLLRPQLDILAANASGGRLGGSVLLNGMSRRMSEYRRLSCYVMQRDVLLESATVGAE